MSAGWNINLCGELRVELAGEQRELRGRQGRLAFAYLVLHRDRAVRRDELIDALWAHEGAPPSDTALAPVLSRLRRAIAPATLEGRETLRLHFPAPVWIDVEAIRTAEPRQVAALTEPGLLPQFDVPWLREPREALEEQRLNALEWLARAGDERAGREAVAAAPFRESARVALIEALIARGNHAEALRTYDELRVLLREELGTTPGPDLIALHERLLEPAPRVRAARPAGLVEREDELAAITGALARLATGEGGVLAFEGPAGIGKTRLLGVLRERALDAGVTVLDARAGVLEREFGFGVVRQLFEAVAAADPPPAGARAVFGGEAVASEGLFSVLSALFQYTAGLATRGPLVLAIDDLQWSDTSSLRFVAYLARRIAALPVLVATTVRTGEPDVDELLLGEVGQDPATVAVQPRPLSADGTAGVVGDVLGADADGAFVAACREVTGGNPLLLRQLLAALAAEQVVPDAAHAASVRAIGPRAVSKTVLLRLARLPAPAVDVARAVAVLGEGPELPALAALAGTTEDVAAETIEALTRAEILRADEPLGFVHPLVRDAVYLELPAARRGLEHARAARLLVDLGATPERIAAQLMLAPPRGDAWVVERLREAARIAIERGAPDAALTHLQRAQDEPPAPEERAALTLELGTAAEFLRGTPAAEALAQAHASLTDPDARGLAALLLARTLLFMDPADAMDVVDRALAELQPGQEDLEYALRAIRIVGVFFGVSDPANLRELEAWRAGPRGQGPGAKTLTAITSLAVAILLGGGDEAAALARESLEGDAMPQFDRGTFTVLPATVLTLDEPASSEPEWVRIRALSARRGSVLDAVGADLWSGYAALWTGDLVAAVERLEHAMEGEALFGSAGNAHMAYSSAFLALAWHERGDRERAWEALRHAGDQAGPSDGERFWMISHAELLLADGETARARALAEALAATRPPDMHPLWHPWRSLLARAAAAEGDRDTASRLAGEELALARRRAAPWVVGRSLRLLGSLTGDADALREAVTLLDATSARLERAKAHAAAGNHALASELARACGAVRLAV
ncbi:AAA family ATPase [Solirubrobacter phytolaccae]|uniref:AAA family ATPase n=1 Tax=Solirubrobacter phytolaccae TaxID=1404360 RepID=A0A9X3N7M8_9ACTN|nr:AAA family ATPase [Solirubrobacter phytolaccae]MDA0179201.1 AAA family ATPase [Solirubrobacter phytolaccae]